MKTILLLGGAAIQSSDGSLTGHGQRARLALLAILATARERTVSRARLLSLLWPDSDGDRARHLLREAIYRLRELLGESALVATGAEIRLDECAVQCDVWLFEQTVRDGNWTEALRLHRGPLLEGFSFSGSPEFAQWLEAERTRIAGLYSASLTAAAVELRQRVDWCGAAEILARHAASDPFNSSVALQLLEALEAAGDRSGALRHAEQYTELLTKAVGAEPDPAFRAIAERLRESSLAGPAENRYASPESSVLPHARPDIHAVPQPTAPGMWHRARVFAALGGATMLLAGFAGMRALRVRPVVDVNRIAIMPARVSGADPSLSWLSDGLVELLALHFTGDVGPAAIDPGEILSVSHRSGRELDARQASRVARDLGAGQVVTSAIVGTSERFTVSVSALSSSDGATRVGSLEVTGNVNDLSAVVAELATRIRAAYADAPPSDIARVHTNILRLYVDGMASYRNASWVDAGVKLFSAFEQDSTFVPAAYRFALIHARVAPNLPLDSTPRPSFERLGPGVSAVRWFYRALWSQRDRLPAHEKQLLEAITDDFGVLWNQRQLPRLERVVELVPRSVEAWELLGDAFYHAGSLLGRSDWAERSSEAFSRAFILDSAVSLNAPGHLADLAFWQGDKSSFARYSRRAAEVDWKWGNPSGSVEPPRGPAYRAYQAAILDADQEVIHQARIGYARSWARGDESGPHWAFRGMTIPANELDSLLRQMSLYANSEAQRYEIDDWLSDALAFTGHTDSANTVLRRWAAQDSILYYAVQLARAENDVIAGEQLGSLLKRRPIEGMQASHPLVCDLAHSRLRRGDTTGVTKLLETEPRLDSAKAVLDAYHSRFRRGTQAQRAVCAEVARAVLSSLLSESASPLFRADSLMRSLPVNYADYWNYDLAVAFARYREYALATAAARRRFHDMFPVNRLIVSLRNEGRWSVLAGDTASAVDAYEHYLVWRSDPDPELIPQRDSVRTELARLKSAHPRRAGR